MGTSGLREVGVGHPTALAQQSVARARQVALGSSVLTPLQAWRDPQTPHSSEDPHPNILSHSRDH